MQTFEDFWSRFDKLAAGAGSMNHIERESGLGNGTVRKARDRGIVPGVLVRVALAKHFGVSAHDLMGDDAPSFALSEDPTQQRIMLGMLRPSPSNPRKTIDPESLAGLADSIAEHGLLQNLVVREAAPGDWIVIAGERRLRALNSLFEDGRLPAEIAEHGVPCRVTQDESTVLALLENMQREDVNPMEEAEALTALHETDPVKWSTAAIAAQLGKTQRFVQLRLALVRKLPEAAKEALQAGELTVKEAQLIASLPAAHQRVVEDTGDQYNASPAKVAERFLRNAMPVKFAIFDAAESGLDSWEAPDGTWYFTDYDQAIEAQENALPAFMEKLRAEHPELTWIEHIDWFAETQFPEGGTGAVVSLSETGEVEVKFNVMDARPKRDPKVAEKRISRWEAERAYAAKHHAAADELLNVLADHLDHETALRLLAWDAVSAPRHRIVVALNPRPLSIMRQDDLERIAYRHGHASDGAVTWDTLCAHSLQAIEDAITADVCQKLTISPAHPLSPVLADLARQYGIVVPPILHDTAADRTKAVDDYISGQTAIEDVTADAAEKVY